jgi:peptidoglycan/LPS O-acetylase OafA/YrhL
MRSMMLNEQLRQAAHPLNAIRLGLAIAVTIAYSSPIGGICCTPMVPLNPDVTLGSAAVGAFFAISGLLVTMSAVRHSAAEYLAARARRIFPALVVALVVTALILAPAIYIMMNGGLIGFALTGESGALTYVARHLLLGFDLQRSISDIFYPGAWLNISLWTIPIVLRFYLVVLGLVLLGRRFGLARVMGVALCVSALLVVMQLVRPELVASILNEYMTSDHVVTIFPFLFGALVGTLADRIRVSHVVGIGAIVVLVGATVASGVVFRTIGYGSLALVIPYVAWLLPPKPFRWFTHDLSYGTYLWAVPVQQTLAFVGLNAFGLLPFTLLSILCTLPFAAASWFLVERRFLNTKNRYEAVRGGTPS